MQKPSQDGLEILKDRFEDRFFDDKRVLDRDLVALKLDQTVNIKRVLVNKALIARADRVYNEMYWERELGNHKAPNKQKKKKSCRSAARSAGGPAGSAPSLLTQMQLPPDSDGRALPFASSRRSLTHTLGHSQWPKPPRFVHATAPDR